MVSPRCVLWTWPRAVRCLHPATRLVARKVWDVLHGKILAGRGHLGWAAEHSRGHKLGFVRFQLSHLILSPCAPRSLFMMQIAMIGRRQVLKLCCYPVSIASSNDFVKSQQAAAWKVELPAAYRWGLGPVRYRRSAHEEASCKAVWLLDRFYLCGISIYGMYPTWIPHGWYVTNIHELWTSTIWLHWPGQGAAAWSSS